MDNFKAVYKILSQLEKAMDVTLRRRVWID